MLLSFALVAWVALLVVARSQEREAGAHASSGTPPHGGVAGAFQLSSGNAGWKLVWRDEFNEARCPSRSKWSFEHGFVRNGELQWYQPQNASCRDGVLILKARRDREAESAYRPGSKKWKLSRRAADYTSASIASRYSFTYGRAEALIRIDPGPGSCPAYWALGASYRREPKSWPATGEVDVMEYYRHPRPGECLQPAAEPVRLVEHRQSLATLGGQAWADRFHLWAMDWNARRIDLFLVASSCVASPWPMRPAPGVGIHTSTSPPSCCSARRSAEPTEVVPRTRGSRYGLRSSTSACTSGPMRRLDQRTRA